VREAATSNFTELKNFELHRIILLAFTLQRRVKYAYAATVAADNEEISMKNTAPTKATVNVEGVEHGYAYLAGYTDCEPYEIVRVVSEKTIEVRGMKAERDASVELKFHIGGFSANCSNQADQKWNITSDESRGVVRIRKNSKGKWVRNGSRFVLTTEPFKFYDYNF